jgi:hypothetical protein
VEIHDIAADTTCPFGAGNKIIPQVCNDMGAGGAGFLRAISKRWPQAAAEFPGSDRAGIPPSIYEDFYKAKLGSEGRRLIKPLLKSSHAEPSRTTPHRG